MSEKYRMPYGEFMKKSLQVDRLEREELQLRGLIMSLNVEEGAFASHKETGIVYDLRVLNSNLDKIMMEHTLLSKELKENG